MFPKPQHSQSIDSRFTFPPFRRRANTLLNPSINPRNPPISTFLENHKRGSSYRSFEEIAEFTSCTDTRARIIPGRTKDSRIFARYEFDSRPDPPKSRFPCPQILQSPPIARLINGNECTALFARTAPRGDISTDGLSPRNPRHVHRGFGLCA